MIALAPGKARLVPVSSPDSFDTLALGYLKDGRVTGTLAAAAACPAGSPRTASKQ